MKLPLSSALAGPYSLNQWVNWQVETRDGKPTKVPYIPGSLRRASVTDPSTWRSLEAADEDGRDIGFVFTASDPYLVIDLDHCITHGELDPDALEIINSLDSYTEVSPSGTGVHIWVDARMPGKGNRKPYRGFEVEMYDRDRYMTVTGTRLNDRPIREAQEDVDNLHALVFGEPVVSQPLAQFSRPRLSLSDGEIVMRMERSQSGARVRALMAGDTSEHGGDDSRADLALASHIAFWTQDRSQIERIMRSSGLARDKWNKHASYLSRTIDRALSSRLDTYSGGGRESLPDAPEPRRYNLTDLGNAERFVHIHGDDVRYCHSSSDWYIWSGTRWALADTGDVAQLAAQTVRSIYAEAAACDDSDLRKATATWAKQSESHSRLVALMALATSIPPIPVKRAEFDTNAWMLNCMNGTIDLRTGELHPHRKDDMLTKVAPATYLPGADCAGNIWRSYLAGVQPDQTICDFLQRAAGYTLTGDCSEEVLFFLHGPAAAGKSTFVEALKSALGDYSATLDFSVLLKSRYDSDGRSANPEIAKLPGTRMAISIEVSEGKRLAEGLVKTLTGGDTISARGLYERRNTEFVPQFKLWLVANDAPRMRDTDDALWRRVLIIPFNRSIPPESRDPRIKQELRFSEQGRAAVLAWAVQGCLLWQQYGLAPPPAVQIATQAMRLEMDPCADFWAERCAFGATYQTAAADLRREYLDWCEKNGVRPISTKLMAERLEAKGCTTAKSGSNRYWVGLQLVATDAQRDVWDVTYRNFSLEDSHVRKFTDSDVPDVPSENDPEDEEGIEI